MSGKGITSLLPPLLDEDEDEETSTADDPGSFWALITSAVLLPFCIVLTTPPLNISGNGRNDSCPGGSNFDKKGKGEDDDDDGSAKLKPGFDSLSRNSSSVLGGGENIPAAS